MVISWLFSAVGVALTIPGVMQGSKFALGACVFCSLAFVAVTIMNIMSLKG
jgi:hypothetical protein